MLAAGGSDYPMDILRVAGVDLSSPEPVSVALEEFDRTVTEMEELAEQGVLEAAVQAASEE